MEKPHSIKLAFYGDDFTGSTDAMEFLEKFGLRTMLFMEVSTAEQLRGLEGRLDAIGIAGSSRSIPTEEMERKNSDNDRKAFCSRRLGAALGRIGRRVLSELPLRRVAVTGGDTSGQVASILGIN